MKPIKSIFSALIIFVCLLAGPAKLRAQDTHFSQYYSPALFLSPAMAGIYPYLTLSTNYRSQWQSIGAPYLTNQISLIKPLYTKSEVAEHHIGGIGLAFYNDKAGEGSLKSIGGSLNAAYNLLLTRDKMHNISFGVQVGFFQKKVDFSSFQWGSQYNTYIGNFDNNITPSETNINVSTSYVDAGAGLIYYYNVGKEYDDKGISGYLGLSAAHLNGPNESMIKGATSKLPVLAKVNAGLEFKTGEKLRFSPNVLVMSQDSKMQINGGAYLTYLFGEQEKYIIPTDVIVGAWYRLKDSYIISCGLANDNFSLGFSYDLNNSGLRYYTNGKGAYEISLVLMKVTKKKDKRFYSPRF